MSARNEADRPDEAAARSIAYFRVSAVAALICAVGSGVLGSLALARSSDGRVFTGLGLVLTMLGIVLLALAVACARIVSQLQARARASKPRHGKA